MSIFLLRYSNYNEVGFDYFMTTFLTIKIYLFLDLIFRQIVHMWTMDAVHMMCRYSTYA
jgi:hypothetical protein